MLIANIRIVNFFIFGVHSKEALTSSLTIKTNLI